MAAILDRRIEMPALRADGTEFPAEVTVTRTGLPGEAAFTAFVRDTAGRRRAEQELVASRARLVTTSDAARQRITRDLHDGAQQHLVATGPATRAWVRLEIAAGRCVVEVRDDGIGGAHPEPETSGLIGLSDRIGAIGGTLHMTSPRSGGTTLRASVPVPEVKIKGDLAERAVLRAPSLVTASRRIGP